VAGVNGNGRRVAEMSQTPRTLQPIRPVGWHTRGPRSWPSSSACLKVGAASGPHGRQSRRGRGAGQRPALSVPRVSRRQQSYAPCHRCVQATEPPPQGAAGAAPSGQAFRQGPGETVAFKPCSRQSSATMAASLNVPLLPVTATRHQPIASIAFYKQVKARGVTMTAVGQGPWRLSWLAIPQGQCGLQRGPAGLSGQRQWRWRWPWMGTVACSRPSWQTRQNRPFIPLAQLADLVAPSRHQTQLTSEYSTGLHPLQPRAWIGVDRFDASCRGHRRHPGCGAFAACVVGGQRRPISVTPDAGETHRRLPSSMAPRRGLLQGSCRLDRNRPGNAWPSDVSAAPEDGDSTPNLRTLQLRLRSACKSANCQRPVEPATPPGCLGCGLDGSAPTYEF